MANSYALNRRGLASVLLTLLGLLSTVGMLTGAQQLALFAHATLASPFLVVYSEPRGYRIMTLRTEVTLYTGNEQKMIELNRDTYLAMTSEDDIFNRHILTLGYMAAIFMLLDPKDAVLREHILRNGFCMGGPMAGYFDVPDPVTRVRIVVNGKFPPEKVVGELDFTCPTPSLPAKRGSVRSPEEPASSVLEEGGALQ